MAALWSGFRGGRLCIDLIIQLLDRLPTSAARISISEIISCFAAPEEILQFLERQFRSAGQLLSYGRPQMVKLGTTGSALFSVAPAIAAD